MICEPIQLKVSDLIDLPVNSILKTLIKTMIYMKFISFQWNQCLILSIYYCSDTLEKKKNKKKRKTRQQARKDSELQRSKPWSMEFKILMLWCHLWWSHDEMNLSQSMNLISYVIFPTCLLITIFPIIWFCKI